VTLPKHDKKGCYQLSEAVNVTNSNPEENTNRRTLVRCNSSGRAGLNPILRNDDGSTRQESERHRVIVWGMHAEKVARLLRKGSKIRVQGRMTYPTWKDKQTGATRYGAEIVAQTLDYQGANDEDEVQAEQVAVEAPTSQPAEPVAAAEEMAKPKRSRSKKTQAAAA
jgi:single stranded DNA-binding protein